MPLGETLEVWRIRLTNERAIAARLSLFGTVEFCLWDAQDDATNFQRNYSIGEVEVEDGVIYHTTEYRERRDHFAYFACSGSAAGFDTSRDAFLGPYRGWDRPIAVERGTTSGSIAHGWQPIGAHQVRLELAPGRDARGRLRARLRREPGGRQVRPAGIAERSTSGASARSSPATSSRPSSTTASPRSGRSWDERLGVVPGRDRQRAPRPDGQHLERLPVHGHVQPVALRLAVRVRDRARDGLPRLEPGPARVRPHGSRAGARGGSSTSPRRSCRAAAPTTSTSR